MKSKLSFSLTGLVLIAASLSAFTSFMSEEKVPVKTEFSVDDNLAVQVAVESYTIVNKETGIQRVIFSNSQNKADQVTIKAIKTVQQRAAATSSCQCEMAVVDADAGTCVTYCYIGGSSGQTVWTEHDCCNQPMYPCQ